MSIFIDQMEKRRRLEESALRQTYHKAVRRMGLLGQKRRPVPPTDRSAICTLLDALGVKEYELADDLPTSPEERLAAILLPQGIMMRKVRLKAKWWKSSVGPMLGYDKEGNLTALLPTYWGFGYTFADREGVSRRVDAKAMETMLKDEAFSFTQPLPDRKLTCRDLVMFAVKSVSPANVVLLLAAAWVLALFGMVTPMANKLIFDMVVPTGDAGNLLPIFGLLAGAGTGTVLFSLTRNLCAERVRQLVDLHLHNAIMARVFLLSPKFFAQHSSGELTSRVNNIWRICKLLNENLTASMLTLLFSSVYMVQVIVYAKSLIVPTLVIISVELLTLAAYYYSLEQSQVSYNDEFNKLNGMEYGMLAGIQKLKQTGSERRALALWLDKYARVAHHIYYCSFTDCLIPALLQLCNVGGTGVMYYFILRNDVSTSDYIAFASAYGMIASAIAELISIVPKIAQVKPMLLGLQPILDAVPETGHNAQQVDGLSGSIEMAGVSFRYTEDTPMVIDNLSLKIEPGEYVGLVGKSGCGKSTLMRLLLGFEQPLKGGIYYDRFDLAKVDKASLRRRIGCCLQNDNLFAGDLFHNITVTAPWATREEAWEALRMADMDKDVERLPMGLDTVVSEGGSGFSGGQKQRLLIARALMGHPQIIFFDEATSALDNISQKQVSDNLGSLHCTRLVIAQRLSTIRHCDRIIVLDKGRIAEEGNFDELMAKRGLFYEMSLRQM